MAFRTRTLYRSSARLVTAPLLAIVLWSVTLPAQVPHFTASTADIVAWNLSGFEAIPDDRQARVVRAIADLDPEVIAAVEVNPNEVIYNLAAQLTELGPCYNALILDQTAIQNIGVIFKCEVQVTNPRLVPNSDDGNSALRKAFAVDVRLGQFDFLLVVLHLKAGRGASDRATRSRQVAGIAGFIADATTGGQQDVLVVGDYNMIPGEDDANFSGLNPTGLLRFISSEDLTGQFSHISDGGTCNHGNLLDGFAVSQGQTTEYIEGSLRIYPIFRALGLSLCDFGRDVSDHLPLIARFRILVDDDGETSADANIRITAVLPNPVGSDNNAETVTLRNFGSGDVSLVGWRIADDDGNDFALLGSIAATATRVITLERPAMLSNDGDEVRLLSPNGIQHTVNYEGSQVHSGQTIVFATP